MEQEREYQEIDLRELLFIFRMRWYIIVICLVVAVAASGIISYFVLDPVYKAESLLFVGQEEKSRDVAEALNLSQIRVNQQLVNDYRELIKSRTASEAVIESLELDIDPNILEDGVTVTTVNESRMFKISYQSTDPKLAANIVNEMSKVIIQKATEVVKVKNIRVVDKAKAPKTPVKPNKKMNMAIAVVLGIMAGAFIVFIIEYFDNTIKTASDIEKHLGLNIMGEIPAFDAERRNFGENKGNKYK